MNSLVVNNFFYIHLWYLAIEVFIICRFDIECIWITEYKNCKKHHVLLQQPIFQYMFSKRNKYHIQIRGKNKEHECLPFDQLALNSPWMSVTFLMGISLCQWWNAQLFQQLCGPILESTKILMMLKKIQGDNTSGTVDLKKAYDSPGREVLYNILTEFSILQN